MTPTAMFSFQVLIICLGLCLIVSAAPEYQFSFGRIAGVDKEAESTLRPYYAFYGIPYAAPPVGNLRFRAPQPYTNPTNDPNTLISANSYRAACIQPGKSPDKMSEDCLHLNVFTPSSVNNGGTLKKVMVWIHGGAFRQGSADLYRPSRLVTDYDVIIVVVQYRLGVLGFLDPGSGREANFGLRDQISGIQWVKDNIRQFGGDPDDITIFGGSAGSISASLLALSPLSKGLFTKVISQSGVALSSFATNKNPQQQFMDVATRLGCTSWLHRISSFFSGYLVDNIVNCLRNKPLQAFGGGYSAGFGNGDDDDSKDDDDKQSEDSDDAGEGFDATNPPTPSVDGVVIPRSPESLMADKTYLQVNGVLDRSYIVGFNNNEGLFLSFFSYMTFAQPKQAEQFAARNAKTILPSPVTDDVMDFVFYEYTYPRGNQGVLDLMNVINVNSDVTFVLPSVQFVRTLSSISPSTPVYLYLLDHYPELVDPSLPIRGTPHAYETMFEFDKEDNSGFPRYPYYRLDTPSDQPLYNVFRNSFANFAKTGVPSSQEYSSWPRFRPEDEYYLAMSTSPEVRQRVYAKRMDLWTKIIPMKIKQVAAGRRPTFY